MVAPALLALLVVSSRNVRGNLGPFVAINAVIHDTMTETVIFFRGPTIVLLAPLVSITQKIVNSLLSMDTLLVGIVGRRRRNGLSNHRIVRGRSRVASRRLLAIDITDSLLDECLVSVGQTN